MIENLKDAINHAREVAIDRNETANNTPTVYGDYINSCRECAAEHEQLAEWLTELQERREADRWIPVSERLPEESDDYLIQLDNNWNEQLTAFFSKGVGFCFLGSVLTDVIYWRPLPKPYESEDQ